MNIVFVAPRVHPNQVPIISGLIEKGHSVYYLVQRESKFENHAEATVITIEESKISALILRLIRNKKGIDYAERKSIYYYLPRHSQLKKELAIIKPDVVIVRNRTLFSFATIKECKKYKSKVLLYNQTPQYENKEERYINPYLKKIISHFFPKKRMTVVRYKNYPFKGNTKYVKDCNATFIPFVTRKTNYTKSEYCTNSIVHIFDSGKFRDYKNHFFLVDMARKLKDDGYNNFELTIQGQCENRDEKDYFSRLKQYIDAQNVTDRIKLLQGVPYNEMESLFLSNDVYILASKSEVANISILDAMMYGLLTISTSANGTADYICPNQTGEVYKSGSLDSLCEIVESYLDHPDRIGKIGGAAHKFVEEHYSFDNYYHLLLDTINDIEN